MMSIVFKVVTFLFSVILAGMTLLVAAVPDSSQVMEETQGIPKQKQSNTLHILQSQQDISLQLQQAADLFSEEYPVEISVQTVPGRSYTTALRSKLLAQEKVDLFHLSSHRQAQQLQEYLLDLSHLNWIGDTHHPLVSPIQIKQSTVAIPYAIDGIGLLVRTDILEAAGIQLDFTKDFESLEKAFLQLRDSIQGGELSEAFPQLENVCEFAAGDTTYLEQQISNIVLGGQFDTPTQVLDNPALSCPNSKAAEELITLLARCSASSKNWPELTNIALNEQLENGLASGRVVAAIQNADAFHRIYQANPKLYGKLGLLPLPLKDSESPVLYIGTPAFWAVRKDSQLTGPATDFLNWLYQSPQGAQILAEEFQILSPYQKTAQDTKVRVHSQILGQIRQGQVAPQIYQEYPDDWGVDCFAVELQEFFTQREKTWDNVISRCQEQWLDIAY